MAARRKAIPLADIIVNTIGPGQLPVVTYDPGGTTGLAVISVEAATMYPDMHGKLLDYRDSSGITVHVYAQEGSKNESDHAKAVIALATWANTETGYKVPIVGEDFTLRIFSQSSDLLSPVRINAEVKDQHKEWTGFAAGDARRQLSPVLDNSAAFGEHEDEFEPVSQLFWQQPSTAKRTATDARLERWGLYISAPKMAKGGAHARDALRHGVAFLRRAAIRDALRDLAWGKAV